MESLSNDSQEKEARFVVISSAESLIDCTDKPYELWTAEQATSFEELIMVAGWVCTRKIVEPDVLLQTMSAENYPLSHRWIEQFSTERACHQLY